MCFSPNRLTKKRLPYTYPGGRRGGQRQRGAKEEKQEKKKKQKEKRERRKMREMREMRRKKKEQNGKTPTLELGCRGQRPDRASARVVLLPIPPTPSLPREVRDIGEIEAKDGLPSADRNNKATLLLTGPFRTAKSSAKDLTPLVLKLQYAKYRGPLRGPRRNRLLRH
jgi:hypothetical protein